MLMTIPKFMAGNNIVTVDIHTDSVLLFSLWIAGNTHISSLSYYYHIINFFCLPV